MQNLSILNLGDHNTNKRIWIANRNILKAGFRVGESIHIDYNKDKQHIEVTPSDLGRHTVSGRDELNPIVDIKNAQVRETLGSPEKIEVTFYEKRIVISVSKSEQKRTERRNKSGMKMFELFAGGGTLHSFFKEAGYQSIGGLEMNDKYLAVFDVNNPEKEVVTICGAIEDVEPNDYPKDADLVVAGIPCTSFSSGNVQMQTELSKLKKGEQVDSNIIAKRYEAEALVFHVLTAIQHINPNQVVVEEVEAFSNTPACMLLRTVLGQWGFHLSETVAYAKHTKRKRWCLIADMHRKVDLSNLEVDDELSLEDFLDTPVEEREWVTIEQSKRFSKASSTVGLRSHEPHEQRSNTFTTHSTRSTEPCLKKAGEPLYSEFTNSEIAKIHGLKNFVLSGIKTLDRQILGQGVADMFAEIAKRVAQSKLLGEPKQQNDSSSSELGQLQLFA